MNTLFIGVFVIALVLCCYQVYSIYKKNKLIEDMANNELELLVAFNGLEITMEQYRSKYYYYNNRSEKLEKSFKAACSKYNINYRKEMKHIK